MANRFSQISTSSFKPLSLDEIMAVPLAKQVQHDEASLALDEFSKMEANSLDKDKEYVTGQIQAFQKESDDVSNQLLDSGVNRNLTNKIKSLRNRKNQEFSLQGKTGQASAAYNQYKENEKQIMARKDLTAKQKQYGLAKAKNDYLGVAEGGTYQDYIGTSSIDVMEKGRQIASQMTPEEKADALRTSTGQAWGYDSDLKMYTNGTYKIRELKPEHIQQVVYQALKSDRTVNEYVNELQELGIESDGDAMLRDAAVNAGNIYQIKENNQTAGFLAGQTPGGPKDPTVGYIAPDHPWNSMDVLSDAGATALNEQYEVLEPEDYGELFGTNGLLKDEKEFELSWLGKKAYQNSKEEIKWAEDEFASGNLNKDDRDAIIKSAKSTQAWWETGTQQNYKTVKQTVTDLRKDYPNLEEATDEDVYKAYSELKKDGISRFSQVIAPMNPKSTYYALEERLLGKGDANGTFASKNVKMQGMPSGSTKMMAENLDMKEKEFNDMIRTTGKRIGFAPGLTDMPGADAIQFTFPEGHDRKGQTDIIYFAPDNSISSSFKAVGRMNDAKIQGIPYMINDVVNGKEMISTAITVRTNPKNGKKYYNHESYVFNSKVEVPQEELKAIEYTYYTAEELRANGAPSATIGEYIGYTTDGHLVRRRSYDEEIQRVQNQVTRLYDRTPNASQGLSKAQKN